MDHEAFDAFLIDFKLWRFNRQRWISESLQLSHWGPQSARNQEQEMIEVKYRELLHWMYEHAMEYPIRYAVGR